jgi:hypothetical protein
MVNDDWNWMKLEPIGQVSCDRIDKAMTAVLIWAGAIVMSCLTMAVIVGILTDGLGKPLAAQDPFLLFVFAIWLSFAAGVHSGFASRGWPSW